MKILEKIPAMNDREIDNLFQNATDHVLEGKNVDNANKVIAAIETEWNQRLFAHEQGDYKADTPEEGVLKRIGYKVGLEGEKTAKRRRLLLHVLDRTLPNVGSPAYMAEWGKPGSKQRYVKLQRVISNIAFKNRNMRNIEKAQIEWHEDLDWLYAVAEERGFK